MAYGQDDTQHTQSTDGAGDDSGSDSKLIFGKYKTLEEAERGHKELERKFHEGNEKFVRLESRLDRFEQMLPQDDGYGRGVSHAEPVQRETIIPAGNGTQLLTRFYSDPEGTLAEVAERATQQAIQRVTQATRQQQDYAARVAQWSAANPDVAAYGDLLTHYVQQTDGRLAPETRLDKAAEMVRKRVLELKGKPQKQNDDPTQFVDGATSAHGAANSGGNAPTQLVGGESQLKSYVAQRNSSARKPLQHGGDRK